MATKETTGRLPTVTTVPGKSHDFVRCYRFAGGDLAPEWADSITRRGEGRTAWCEVSVWIGQDGQPDSRVGSYGGSVWPTAWPDLFESVPSSASGGSAGILLTEAGRALIRAATPEAK